MNDGVFDNLYAREKPEPFVKKYGKRILSGVCCSLVVYFFMHMSYVRLAVQWTAEVVQMVLGRPPGAKEIDKGKDVAIDVFHKGKEILHAHQEDKPKLASVISSVPVVKGIEAKAHAVKDVADKAKAVEQKAVEVRDTIKGTGEKVVNALENVGGKAKEAATGGLSHLTEAWHARKEEQEKAAREMLMVRARYLGMEADDSWSLIRLQAEVAQAEEAAWQRKYNARCPMPKCHYPLHISDRMKRERIRCPRCQEIISGSVARSLGPPPMPRRR